MASQRYGRVLDPTARDPEKVYWCCSHRGFSDAYDPNNGGHYPKLTDDVCCKHCVVWEDLCDSWLTLGDPDVHCGTVRCQRAQDHEGPHLIDDLNGQRYSWQDDSHEMRRDVTQDMNQLWGGPSAAVIVEGQIGSYGTFTINVT